MGIIKLTTILNVLGNFITKNMFHLKIFKRVYLFFRERGREGEIEEEKHQCVAAFQVSPTGYLPQNPGMCPDWESNWRPFGLQAHIQPTELYQLGPYLNFIGHNYKKSQILKFSKLSCCFYIQKYQIPEAKKGYSHQDCKSIFKTSNKGEKTFFFSLTDLWSTWD